MKRLLFILLACLSMACASAETLWFKTYSFKQATVYNGQYSWGASQNSDMNISIDLDSDLITVYSPRTQYYYVYDSYNNGNAYRDSGGGTTIKYYVIDQDGDKGELRLRMYTSGGVTYSQIYVDFSNIAWVYGVRRI